MRRLLIVLLITLGLTRLDSARAQSSENCGGALGGTAIDCGVERLVGVLAAALSGDFAAALDDDHSAAIAGDDPFLG